jgi:hypothetical protein
MLTLSSHCWSEGSAGEEVAITGGKRYLARWLAFGEHEDPFEAVWASGSVAVNLRRLLPHLKGQS